MSIVYYTPKPYSTVRGLGLGAWGKGLGAAGFIVGTVWLS